MKQTIVRMFGVLAFLGAAAGSAGAAPPVITRNPTLDTELEQQVQPLLNKFQAAWNRHDVQALASAFTSDAVLINPSGKVARGNAEIQKLLQQEQQGMMKNSQFSHRITDVRQVAPGLVFLDEEITITGVTSPAGQPVPDLQIHGAMLLSNRGGSWKILEGRPYRFMTPEAPPAVGGSGAGEQGTPQEGLPPQNPESSPGTGTVPPGRQ